MQCCPEATEVSLGEVQRLPWHHLIPTGKMASQQCNKSLPLVLGNLKTFSRGYLWL